MDIGVPHTPEELYQEIEETREIFAKIIGNAFFKIMSEEYGIDLSKFKLDVVEEQLPVHHCAVTNAEYGITDEERMKE